jgi:hypothetical protein
MEGLASSVHGPLREETMTMRSGVVVIYDRCCRVALFILGFLALFDANEKLPAWLD